MKVAAVIVAGGRGARLGGAPKQWRPAAGKPLAGHALDALHAAGVTRAVLVHHPDDAADAARLARPGLLLVRGGASRPESVRAGLEALATDPP
jgi:2-C-methyl-D-erythritol 4-phosphate cytidylyltransferase